MSIMRSKQFVYIDSSNRSSGTDGSFSYDLKLKPNNDFDHVCVLQCNIPKSWYQVQSGLNTFILVENGVQHIVTLPVGNYTRNSFKNTLQTELNTSGTYTYAIASASASDVDTGKFAFTVSNNSGHQPSFIISDNGLYLMMGFDFDSTNTFAANSLSSSNVINLQSPTVVYLHSDLASNPDDNILLSLMGVENPQFGNITFQCSDLEAFSKPLTTNSHTVANFSVTDSDGLPLSLNGQSVNITLLFYKKQDVYELARQYLKLDLLKSLQ